MRLLILLFLLGNVCFAQTNYDFYTGFGNLGVTRFNTFQGLGKKEVIDYSEVRGNCFWDTEWNAALLVLKSGTAIKLRQVKLNLYTNYVHYLDNKGSQAVASPNPSKVIFFDKKDTTKVVAVFLNFINNNKECYSLVLAGTEIQLVRNYAVSMDKEYDRVNAEYDYRFRTFNDYSIIDHGKASRLKSINKTDMLAILKPTKEQEEWLLANKNKLKKEADAIAYISYLNSTLEQK